MYQNIKQRNTEASRPQPTFNPFRFLAYQRIFYDFYRHTDYIVNEPRAYNIDNSSGGTAVDAINAQFMFYPRYSLWHKDRITSVKPSPLSVMQTTVAVIPLNGEGLSDAIGRNP